jgi:hypothetical protein
MKDKLEMVEIEEDTMLRQRMEKFRRNGEWLTEHDAPLFEQFVGQYIAVSEGKVFVAADAWEVRRLARSEHPNDEPFVQYIPRERLARIYAN